MVLVVEINEASILAVLRIRDVDADPGSNFSLPDPE
jgi:hypothetical protein